MKLSIKERVYFKELFSKNEDSYSEALIQKQIIDKISIAQVEQKEIELQIIGNVIHWNPIKGDDKIFLFTELELEYMKESAYILSKRKAVTQTILSVMQKLYMPI